MWLQSEADVASGSGLSSVALASTSHSSNAPVRILWRVALNEGTDVMRAFMVRWDMMLGVTISQVVLASVPEDTELARRQACAESKMITGMMLA